jgi:N-acetylglutamate synthase-like GNAT family acetyltransferase
MTEKSSIEIIDFSDDLSEPIKTLNYEWLEKYFRVEEGDMVSLSKPKKYILEKGGYIYYAKLNGEIVGTASLLKKSETIYELGKMAVAGKAQGHGIGTILLEHCLTVAKQKQIPTLILYSNTILHSAIHLYRKYGFEEIQLESGLYERANIKMEKKL